MPDNSLQGLRISLGFEHLRRSFHLGVRSLWLHRLRSLLTVLGIVFGVCSVIAMLAVGEGASSEAQEQIRRLGSNNIILRSVKPAGQDRPSSGTSRVLEYGLTYADVNQIEATIPGVRVILPARVVRKEVWNGTRRIDAEILGTVPNYIDLHQLELAGGRYFADIDLRSQANVAVLSAEAGAELFPIDQPVGRSIRVDQDYYQVIGVMRHTAHRASSGGGGGMMDLGGNGGGGGGALDAPTAMRIYIPLTAARHRFGEILIRRSAGSFEAERVELHEATVQVGNQEEVEDIAMIVSDILTKNHRRQDYEIVVPLELLRQAERTKQIFNIVLGAIAAISLIVGGIGIMNIMLASVTERTREIGIRRALGAKRRDIVLQFLIETVILSGAGGIIGVVLGVIIPFGIEFFADMTTIVTPWAPALAFGISALVGIVFGIYPAIRAANMDPVEALRHE